MTSNDDFPLIYIINESDYVIAIMMMSQQPARWRRVMMTAPACIARIMFIPYIAVNFVVEVSRLHNCNGIPSVHTPHRRQRGGWIIVRPTGQHN